MSVNFSTIGPSYGYGGAHESNWNSGFSGCCNRMLGTQQNGLMGALLGGLIGGMAGGGNPLSALMGAGIGGLLGQLFGGNDHGHHCHQQNPCHQQAGSYPPPCGHDFGGPQFGGYQCSPNYGSQYGGYGQSYNQQWGSGQFHPSPQWDTGQGGPSQPWGSGQFNPQWGGNYGQQWGGGNGGFGQGHNFNFGHQCPQQCCCPQQRPPQGQLNQEGGAGKPMEYKTSGGYTIKVDKHTITITDPKGKNKVEHWGDPHENLNGKHIKDWQGKQRTIVLEDGTKITMTAQGPQGVTESTSIYDGRQNVQINNNENKVTHHSMNPRDTFFREQRQYDGETSIFTTNRRTGVATYANVYTQDSSFNVTGSYQQLGSTGGYRNPSKVNDYYDDPRLAHT